MNTIEFIFSIQYLRIIYCCINATLILKKNSTPNSTKEIQILSKFLVTVFVLGRDEGYTVSVLGREEGYFVKYTPPPEGVSEGKARGNS